MGNFIFGGGSKSLNGGGFVVSPAVKSSSTPALSFVAQPQSKTVDEYALATFSCEVAGGVAPYSYQWKKNGTNVGTNSAALSFAATATDNGASITCVVNDLVESDPANLHVNSYSYTLNGTTDYYTLSSTLVLSNDFSVKLRFNTTNINGTFVFLGNSIDQSGCVYLQSGKLNVRDTNYGTYTTVGTLTGSDVDHDLIVSVNSGVLSVSIDGVNMPMNNTAFSGSLKINQIGKFSTTQYLLSGTAKYFEVIQSGVTTSAIGLNKKSDGANQSAQIGGITATIAAYTDKWVNINPAPASGILRAWLQSGQSLSVGQTDAANTVINADELDDVYLFAGLNPEGKPWSIVSDADVAGVKAYKEVTKQTHGYSALKTLRDSLDDGSKYIFAPHGRGGATITALSPDGDPWTNGVKQISALSARAADLSQTLRVEFIDWIHGEANAYSGLSEYPDDLRALHDDYISAVNSATGQTDLPMLLDQTGASYAHDIAKTLLKYTETHADAHMVGPKYMLNRKYYSADNDRVHLNANGYIIQGEYHGIAAHQLITTGSVKSLRPISYQAVGNTIEITAEVPVSPLVIDTTTLPAAPSYGFSYTPPSGAVIYPAVTVTGNKIILDIGTPPLSGGKIDCGYTLNDTADNGTVKIPCTNIRDSQNIASEIAGYTLQNWLVQFDYTM